MFTSKWVAALTFIPAASVSFQHVTPIHANKNDQDNFNLQFPGVLGQSIISFIKRNEYH